MANVDKVLSGERLKKSTLKRNDAYNLDNGFHLKLLIKKDYKPFVCCL